MPSDHDVDHWVERLAGRPGTGADRAADALRDAIQARGDRADQQLLGELASDDAAQQHALQRLRFRLKREGLSAGGLGSRLRVWVPMAAAAMLAIVIGVDSLRSPSNDGAWDTVRDEAPRLRGGADIEIRAAAPEAAASKLVAALAATGVRSTVYLHGGTATLVFDVTPEQLEAVRSAVGRLSPQSVLAAGTNRIVLRPE